MRPGIWLIGARGSVAVTATLGALALRARLVEPAGCVTDLPAFRDAALPGWSDLVIGGHDIVAIPVVKRAEALAAAGVVPARLVAALGGPGAIRAYRRRTRRPGQMLVPSAATGDQVRRA